MINLHLGSFTNKQSLGRRVVQSEEMKSDDLKKQHGVPSPRDDQTDQPLRTFDFLSSKCRPVIFTARVPLMNSFISVSLCGEMPRTGQTWANETPDEWRGEGKKHFVVCIRCPRHPHWRRCDLTRLKAMDAVYRRCIPRLINFTHVP